MPNAYEEFCAALVEHAKREHALQQKCRSLAFAFLEAMVGLGFPKENLRWVPSADRNLETRAHHFDEVREILQDEGCDRVTLQVRAGTFFMWPVLKLRFEDPTFILLVSDRTFSGPDAQVVARDAAAYFLDSMRKTMSELPESWLRDTHPKPMQRLFIAPGSNMIQRAANKDG